MHHTGTHGITSHHPSTTLLQVWVDVRKEAPVHDGKTGPSGTTDKYVGLIMILAPTQFSSIISFMRRIELDEDLPAHGKYYCTPCARYFISQSALDTHGKTKQHRKRIKVLDGPQPHNQLDADWAGGMGLPDNGPTQRMHE